MCFGRDGFQVRQRAAVGPKRSQCFISTGAKRVSEEEVKIREGLSAQSGIR